MENTDNLIAEFMGMDIGHGHMVIDINGRNWTMPKFSFSWDWLMKVVDRIESLGYEVRIEGISCKINKVLDKENHIVSWVCGNKEDKIGLVYKTIVEFIKWYNQQ